MKRAIFITFSIIISVLALGIAVAQINRATCFRKGALPNAIEDAQVTLGKMIFQNSEDEWRSLGVSEPDFLKALKLLDAFPESGLTLGVFRCQTWDELLPSA